MRTLITLLVLASSAAAGFLPLVQDRPKRDNPHDPRTRSLAPPAVVFPTYTPVPTPLPGCSGGPDTANFATFEGGTETWASENFAGYTVMGISAGPTGCFGGQALNGAANLTHGSSTLHLAFKKVLSPAQNWTGRELTVRAYLPPSHPGSSANLYMKFGVSWTARTGPTVTTPAGGGWVQLSFNLASLPSIETQVINEVGVDLFTPPADPDGAVTYRIDSFHIFGGPTPTITPTFSASPTIAFGTPTVSPTASPTASPTPTPLPACGDPTDNSTIATFEGGLESWVSENYAVPPAYTVMSLTAGTPVCLGTQALCGTATWTHAGAEVKVAFKRDLTASPPNWSGSSLSARIYFPSGVGTGTSAKLYLKTGGTYAYQAGPDFNAPAGGGWVMLSYNLASVPTANDVREVGVDVYSPNGQPDGTFTLCLDGVNR